jgi:hypothetical protein
VALEQRANRQEVPDVVVDNEDDLVLEGGTGVPGT